MTLFIVERYLVGWTDAEVRDLLTRTDTAVADRPADGVGLLGTVVIPGDETCLCLFSGPDSDAVAAFNEAAGLPFGRVVTAEWSGAAPPSAPLASLG